MINGSGRCFHFENDTELVFGSFYYKPFAVEVSLYLLFHGVGSHWRKLSTSVILSTKPVVYVILSRQEVVL